MKFSIIIFVLATLWSTQFVAAQLTYPSDEPGYTDPEYVYPSSSYYPSVYPSNVPSSNPQTTSNSPLGFIPFTQSALDYLDYLLPLLSSSCQNTLNQLFYNSTINQCLQGLYTSLLDMTNPIYTLVVNAESLNAEFGELYPEVQTILNNAQGELDQFCSPSAQCGASLVLDATSQLKSSCADMANSQSMSWFYDVIVLVQPAVETLCMKNSTNGYCVVETVSDFLPYLLDDYGDVQVRQLNYLQLQNANITGFLAQFPNNITCTTCVSKITSTFQHDLINASSNVFLSFMQVDSAIVQKCGTNFLTNTSSLSSRLSWTAIAILFFTVAVFF